MTLSLKNPVKTSGNQQTQANPAINNGILLKMTNDSIKASKYLYGKSVDAKSLTDKKPLERSPQERFHIIAANLTNKLNKANFPQDIKESLAGSLKTIQKLEARAAEKAGFKPSGDTSLSGLQKRLETALKVNQQIDKIEQHQAKINSQAKQQVQKDFGFSLATGVAQGAKGGKPAKASANKS